MSRRSVGGNRRDVLLPEVGKDRAGAQRVLVEPFELGAAQQEDAAQHQFGDALGVALRVGQRQRRAPGAAEHQPALDPQMRAQRLDVGDQVPGGVLAQLGVRAARAAAALIEQHDAVAPRIEEAPHAGIGAAARAAVQEHHRLAVADCRSARSRARAAPRPAGSRAGTAGSAGRRHRRAPRLRVRVALVAPSALDALARPQTDTIGPERLAAEQVHVQVVDLLAAVRLQLTIRR